MNIEDEWQLFDIRRDYSLMNDVAAENPKKLDEMKNMFLEVAQENKVLPVGGGLYTMINPMEMKRSQNIEWALFEGMDTLSPVADDYFDKASFEFEGNLKQLHFEYLEPE